MASALASFDILTAVHKHYSVEEWQAFINNSSADVLKHVMVSTGTSDADFEKTKQILDLNPALNFVCIDVANGYSNTSCSSLRKRVKRTDQNHLCWQRSDW